MECSPVNSTNFRIFISKVRKLYIKLRNSEAKLANMFLRWATNFFSVVISIWASLPLRTEAQIFLLYSQGLQPHIVLPSIFILFFFFFFFVHKVKEFTAGSISWYISVSINNMLVSIWCIKGQLAITLIRDSETKTSAEKLVIPVFYLFFPFGSPECITSLPRHTPFKLGKNILKKIIGQLFVR